MSYPSYMRLFGSCLLVLTACSSSSAGAAPDPLPLSSGVYAGTYRVPTVSDELAVAARYDIDEVRWTVSAGVATLDYDLPIGLVGGKVGVTLSGAITSGDTEVTVTGAHGVGSCIAAGSIVTCTEDLADLGELPIDAAVIAQRAAVEYRGPAVDRIQVANLFGSDPIGVVTLDFTRPIVDDSGGR